MEKSDLAAVDPAILTECFALYSRVQSGVTRYLRDDADTYSPMMSRLRADGCKLEPVINGFLAIQRYLGLRNKETELFRYTNRILFMALCMEATEGGDVLKSLPFMHDPALDPVAACFFRVLSEPEFEWTEQLPKNIPQMMLDVLERMEQIDCIEDTPYQFSKEPFAEVEEVTKLSVNFTAPPNKTVH